MFFLELMGALEKCYTPMPKAVMLKAVYDVKKWMENITMPIHNVSNPHVFKIEKAANGKVYLQYKNWGSDNTEAWKPENLGDTEDEGLELLKVN